MPKTILTLSTIVNLKILDLSANDLYELPNDLSNFGVLEELNLSMNRFKSDNLAANLWHSLASIPNLRDLNISKNLLRGIFVYNI